MRFSALAVSAVLAAAQASAWTTTRTPVARNALALGRTAARSRYIAAVQLHSTASSSSVETKVAGEEATESFRLKFTESGSLVSPWHDIALKNDDGSYNMVSVSCR